MEEAKGFFLMSCAKSSIYKAESHSSSRLDHGQRKKKSFVSAMTGEKRKVTSQNGETGERAV